MPKRHRSKDRTSERSHKSKKKHSKKQKRDREDHKARKRQEREETEKRPSASSEGCEPVLADAPVVCEKQDDYEAPRKPIGPQLPAALDAECGGDQEDETPCVRQPIGPARPPQEYLDAMREHSDDPLVGPMPPEIEEEIGDISEDEKSKEVLRILQLVQAESFVDPFQVLGLDESAGDGDVRKRYWRLSLMVHPDKCGHPKAQKAFQAVNEAFNSLGSAAGRESVQSKKDDIQLQKMAELEAERQQRQYEWAAVRGGPGALQAPKGPQTRETWMTELPPERRKPTVALQINKSTFSQRGVHERGDTSSWTNTPTSVTPALSIRSKTDTEPQRPPLRSHIDPIQAKRKSLLDQHLDKLKESKKKKKKTTKDGQGASESSGLKGWRPFDREKDLQAPRHQAKDLKTVIKDAKSLHGRFH